MSNKVVVGAWYAVNNGFQPGEQIEYEVFEHLNQKSGGKFHTFKMFKPFLWNNPRTGQQEWVQGSSLPVDKHRELIDRLNHMIQSGFTKEKGIYVFQPIGQAQQPMQPQYQQPSQQPVQPQYQQPPQQPTQPAQPQVQPNGGQMTLGQPQMPQQQGGQYIPPRGYGQG